MEDVQNNCTARCGGDLHKSAKYHMAKRIAARRHYAKSGTSDSLPTSPEACGAEPSAAATATGSASVESTISLARASAGTCGGVPPQVTSNAHHRAEAALLIRCIGMQCHIDGSNRADDRPQSVHNHRSTRRCSLVRHNNLQHRHEPGVLRSHGLEGPM